MSDLPELLKLKQASLGKKFESLEAELKEWQRLTAPSMPLEKHHSQVARISSGLAGMIEVVGAEVQSLQQQPDLGSFYDQTQRAEFLILEIHRTWQYFRQKLSARQGPPFNEMLAALDEFVWDCYNPVIQLAIKPRQNPPGPPYIELGAVREPPLTFFSSNWSPTASSRAQKVTLEVTRDSGGSRYSKAGKLDAQRLVQGLIPLVEMPWFDITFLPEALLLAHEAAHLLDFDLDLDVNMERNLRATSIPAQRLEEGWIPWQSEVFADLYAALCIGPAFAGALATLLARSPQEVLNTLDPNNIYPTHHIRLLLVFNALEKLGFAPEASALSQTWLETYGGETAGKDFALADYTADLDAVVEALLIAPFDALDGKGFAEVNEIRWTAADQQKASSIRDSLLKEGVAFGSKETRILLAGAQLAFQQNPTGLLNTGPSRQKTQADLINHIVRNRVGGVRGEATTRGTTRPTSATTEADKAKGRELAKSLLGDLLKGTTNPGTP